MTTVTVSIERWTHAPFPSSIPSDRYTVVYTDPQTQRVYRVATRETELDARRFAKVHGWTVSGTYEEGDQP